MVPLQRVFVLTCKYILDYPPASLMGGLHSDCATQTRGAVIGVWVSWNHLDSDARTQETRETPPLGSVSIPVCHFFNWLDASKLLALESLKGLPDTFPSLRSLFGTVVIYSACLRHEVMVFVFKSAL